MDCSPPGTSVHGDSPGHSTGVGCHALLQEIFPIQGSNPGLPHCWWILCHLSHQESPYIYNFILPIFGCAGTSLLLRLFYSCDEWGPLFLAVCRAPHWGGFSCCRAGLWGTWVSVVGGVLPGLQRAGAVVVARRLSSSAACGVFPDQGLNPCLLH